MPDTPKPPYTSTGQAKNGRWWMQCTRGACDHYTAGLLTEQAANAVGTIHQAQHDGATLSYRARP